MAQSLAVRRRAADSSTRERPRVCAAAGLNGDILEKWKVQEKANMEQIDPEVQQFLERSQLAAA
jgi:hypothetical protein